MACYIMCSQGNKTGQYMYAMISGEYNMNSLVLVLFSCGLLNQHEGL